jgi:type II secretory pathway pseudopilin PulG
MTTRRGERGSALLLTVIISLIVIGISGAYVSISLFSSRQTANTSFGLQATYVAEAGAARYIAQLNRTTLTPSGAPDLALDYLGGRYDIVEVVNFGADGVDNDGDGAVDDAFEAGFQQFVSQGTFAGVRRRLQVVITKTPGGVFWNAIFAGNSSGDGAYSLYFGGPLPVDRDSIKGDVYSGGGIRHTGYGQLLNTPGSGPSSQVMYQNPAGLDTAGSAQNPPPNYVAGNQPGLDITAMRYEARANDPIGNPNYVNVKNELLTKGSQGFIAGQSAYNQGNGRALQINDVNEPAHMFRMNPSDNGVQDRNTSTARLNTAKDDFYLEDPTHSAARGTPMGTWDNSGTPDNSWVGSDGGMRVEVSPTGNNKVYYVDGNLWVHSSPTYTYQFKHSDPNGMRITFVVKGNIYLSDNLLYQRGTFWNDALAMIAIKDPNYVNATPQDFMPGGARYTGGNPTLQQAEAQARDFNAINGSGNIFFGDPAYGTTERFESFMYAENNFYDNNLGAGGTAKTNIFGNMTAGNHVQIQRDTSGVGANYKPLEVQFDERIRTGTATPPGLPPTPQTSGSDWTIASWRPVP